MGIQSIGFRAYGNAMAQFNKIDSQLVQGNPINDKMLSKNGFQVHDQKNFNNNLAAPLNNYQSEFNNNINYDSFGKSISKSLRYVNQLQTEKAQAIDEFASGRKQNVHELMITMQKSSLAIKMTSAVRSKVLEAYKEITKLNF